MLITQGRLAQGSEEIAIGSLRNSERQSLRKQSIVEELPTERTVTKVASNGKGPAIGGSGVMNGTERAIDKLRMINSIVRGHGI
jgi:hypothetical protein